MSDKIPQVHPEGDRLLVEPEEVSLSPSSIIYASPITDLQSARVLAVGNGPSVQHIKPGDIIFYFKGTGVKIPYNNKDAEVVNYGTIHLVGTFEEK